ncbi:hypothetical protein [Streptomyces sp. NPDC007991]
MSDHTPSQAEGERDDRQDTPDRTTPSQAEGEREDTDTDTNTEDDDTGS